MSIYDPDEIDDDEDVDIYEACLNDRAWIRTRALAVDGERFAHQKHEEEVHPGVQHKLFVWVCEAKRPQRYCPCRLYELTWSKRDG